MPLTPLEIQKQQFKTSFRGYDTQDVDNFLLLLSKEYEDLFREKKSLQEKLVELTSANNHFKDKETIIEKTLLTAEKAAQERIVNAEKEASIILKEAEIEAERMIEQANEKVRDYTVQIQDLRQQKFMFEQKLRSVIEAHSKLLDFQHELNNQRLQQENIKQELIVAPPEQLEEVEEQVLDNDPDNLEVNEDNDLPEIDDDLDDLEVNEVDNLERSETSEENIPGTGDYQNI